ncbi:hypothetical protein H072_5114 [Dactylellina haptotyla CBS 200.50]|uniref:Mis18 domain-containing protein n=1 Tax=Dactylellina haptotyla (strain CBS 200.50) TaxID=1284197 RepID=S8AIJ1_DACHA|nr:hypothetical protein H072_5114 [Dactylellina haptotyla CBS 200.50]
MPPQASVPDPALTAEEQLAQSIGDPERPFTISCKQCDTILGDSAAAECAVDALDIYVLSAGTNLDISDNAKTPKKKGGPDEVSIYYVVKCGGCKHIVGRKYVAIPKYPHIQDKISLSAVHTAFSYPPPPPPPPAEEGTNDDPALDADESLVGPTQSEMIQDITQLKRFCLVLSDGQDNLTTQVAQLAETTTSSSTSNSDEMKELKSRLASLEESLAAVIENQKRLMNQMKLQSKRSYSDFAVEIPVTSRRQKSSSPKQGGFQQQQQQHLSPPPSMRSEDTSPDDVASENSNKPAAAAAETKLKAKTKTQPREADSTSRVGKEAEITATTATRQARVSSSLAAAAAATAAVEAILAADDGAIVISDGEGEEQGGGDDDHASSEKAGGAGHILKRARLSKTATRGGVGKRGRGGRASTGSIVVHELRIDEGAADDRASDGSAGRVTRSKKSS